MMKKIKYILILALLVSTVALSGCGGKSESTAEQSSYTPTPTDTTVKTTGEKILINDSTLGEIWITELANVPKNTLDKNNFSAALVILPSSTTVTKVCHSLSSIQTLSSYYLRRRESRDTHMK